MLVIFNIVTKIKVQNLDQIDLNTFLSIHISNTNYIKKSELASLKARVTSVKSTEEEELTS